VDAGRARALECLARARPEDRVLTDQCPVEVARDRVDLTRKVGWKL
jgi:hypothetical protein